MSTLTYAGVELAQPKQPGSGKRWAWLPEYFTLYARRHHQRRQLLQLSDHMLKDIGISRVDAIREGSKHFWQD